MNAYVEVTTAEVVAKTERVLVLVTRAFEFAKVAIAKVATSTKRVLSIGGVSLSAIAPDHTFEGGTA